MSYRRSWFLTLSSFVALGVGVFAVVLPSALLETKGVALPNDAATLWVREVGVTILGQGGLLFLVRKHETSPTLRAVLLANALIQLGLLPLEIWAYHERVLMQVSGIVPNSVLHLLLAIGFLFSARRMPEPEGPRTTPRIGSP
jgi:hypothetical protein